MNTNKKEKKSSFNGVASLLATGAGQSVLQIFVLAFFARLLTPENFGVMAIALAIGDIARVVARFGVTQAIVQLPVIDTLTLRVGFTLALIMGCISAALLYSASGLIAELLLMPVLENVLVVMALVLPLVSFSLVSEALLSRNLEFHKIAMSRLWGYIFGYIVVGLLLANNGFGYWSLIFAYLSQQLFQSFIIIYNAPHSLFPFYRYEIAKGIFKFGIGYSLGQIATILALRIDSFIIARLLGPLSLSFYDRSYQLMRFPAFLLATIVDDTLFPVLSKIQFDDKKIIVLFKKALGLLSVTLLPLSVMVMICSDSIVHVLLGHQWTDAVPILQILSSVMLFRSAQRVSTATLRAKGMVYRSAVVQIIYFMMVVVAVFLGSDSGVVGVAYFVSLAIFLNFCLITFLAARVVGLHLIDIAVPILQSFPLTLLLAFATYIVTFIAGYISMGPFINLILVFLVNLLLLFLILRFMPRFFLGEYGFWILEVVKNKLGVNKRLVD